MKMENIRQALYAITGKGARKAIKEQGVLFERETLSHNEFPEECLDLIIEILSTEALLNKPGIDHFIVTITTDMSRLMHSQKQKLLKVICNHYHRYTDMEICWLLGDMIARSYDRSIAMQTFRKLFDSSTDQGKEGIALGLDVLARQSNHDPQLMTEIHSILKQEQA
jgi:hypothetical protein